MKIDNAAVFVGGQRKYKNVNVEVIDDSVVVLNRMNGSELTRYSVVEVAKADMAWDISDASQEGGVRIRLVVQQGCGCTGMHPYETDGGYSGILNPRRR